jgi:4-hydroxybutyryl-CoA dehydratase/vinylacetyl-CoA-Delta-isomerase
MDGRTYRASLDDGRKVYVDGAVIGNVGTDPHFAINVRRASATYDLFARDSAARDAFMTPPTGVESLRQRSDSHVDELASMTYTTMMTLLTAADRIAKVRPQAREAVDHFVGDLKTRDARITECITDAKGDRAKPPAQQPDKDAYLRVVGRRDGGVIIRGAKLHVSMAAIGHELMVIPTKAMKPDEPEYAIACAVPVNAPGVSIVSVHNGRMPEDADARDFPHSSQHALPQGFVIFDDVFVPEERIFLDGETGMSAAFAHSLGLWVRAAHLNHVCDDLDTITGFAQLIAEANGTDRIGHIKDKIANMAITATLVRATLEASIAHATAIHGGIMVPDEVFTNAGKYHAAASYASLVRDLLDIAGGSAVTAPSARDLENAEIGPLVRKYMATKPGIEGEYRLRLFRAIHDLTASAYGGHRHVALLQSGGGLYAQSIVTRGRYDMDRAKRLALESFGWESGAADACPRNETAPIPA